VTTVTEPSTRPARPSRGLFPIIDRAAAYSWRLIVIGIVVVAALWLLRQARVVFFPIVVALFVARALSPIVAFLRRHRWRPGLAVAATLVAFFTAFLGFAAIVVGTFADEVESVRPTLTQAIDDVEDWLVTDSPIRVSREGIDRLRERAADEFDRLSRSSDGNLTDQATLVAELLTGTILAIILTFFMLRDGERFAEWTCRLARHNQNAVRRSLDAAWATLGGYLRGAAVLGAVEAVIIGVTLLACGGSLVAPVMAITFVGAFVPIAGAVAAGLIAVLVALVTAGTGAAIIVAIVALIVQQLDNDVLAPVIYGRVLRMHPVLVLLSVVAGGALFGIAGSILAVPVVAVAINSTREYTSAPRAARTSDRAPIRGRFASIRPGKSRT
jgi:predicted PurR-regulated permease PerM